MRCLRPQPRLRFASLDELNGWLEAECRRWAELHPHPEHKELTVAEAWEAERSALQPMLAPFWASNARTKASPSILPVLARRRLRDVAMDAGSTT